MTPKHRIHSACYPPDKYNRKHEFIATQRRKHFSITENS